MRILLAEDDAGVAGLVKQSLERAGFVVDHVVDGPDVWERGWDEAYGAVVLDLGLPGLDGLTLLKRWRLDGNQVPVLVLTARGSWMERVDGFDAGADDYLPKPFRTEELIARLRAILRRSQRAGDALAHASRFSLDENQMAIRFDGQSLNLSQMEYRLLSHLVRHAGQIVPHMDIANHVHGRDDDGARNAVEALVARIRRKTAADAIETRRGFGYLVPAVAPS